MRSPVLPASSICVPSVSALQPARPATPTATAFCGIKSPVSSTFAPFASAFQPPLSGTPLAKPYNGMESSIQPASEPSAPFLPACRLPQPATPLANPHHLMQPYVPSASSRYVPFVTDFQPAQLATPPGRPHQCMQSNVPPASSTIFPLVPARQLAQPATPPDTAQYHVQPALVSANSISAPWSDALLPQPQKASTRSTERPFDPSSRVPSRSGPIWHHAPSKPFEPLTPQLEPAATQASISATSLALHSPKTSAAMTADSTQVCQLISCIHVSILQQHALAAIA